MRRSKACDEADESEAGQRRRRGESIGPQTRVAAAVAAGAVLFLPWLPAFLAQAGSTGTPWDEPKRPASVLVTSIEHWGGGTCGEGRRRDLTVT